MRSIALVALALAGCQQAQKADDRICLTAPSEIAPGDMKACVHKWAYRLAQSSDPAETVAKAVVGACNEVASYAAEKVSPGPTEAGSKAYQDALAIAETDALFRVVQARAGHCEVP